MNQELKKYTSLESPPQHPDVLTDKLDMYEQIKVNKDFTDLWTSELGDVETVGNGLARAHRRGTIDDAKQERGEEYTAEVGDSPADIQSAEQVVQHKAEVAAAAEHLQAQPTGNPGELSSGPDIPKGISVDDLGGHILEDDEK